MQIKTTIKEFIVNNFLFGDGSKMKDDDASFLENGIVDSTGILEIITFIEEQWGIKVDDNELMPENLDSLNNIEKFITRKKTPSPALKA